jgi:hypothetical protein
VLRVHQGGTHPAIDGGATVRLSMHIDDAAWRQALSAIAASAAARAAQAAAAEIWRQLRAAQQQPRLPAVTQEVAAEPSGLLAEMQAGDTPAAAADQPCQHSAPQAAVRQEAAAVNARELESALRLHGQVGSTVISVSTGTGDQLTEEFRSSGT